MFHISTLLPHSKENKQQVERKRTYRQRHCKYRFLRIDSSEQCFLFKPSMMKTRFTLFSEESVPLFGPPLPTPPVFYDHQEFRDFLLVKLINGEKAAVNNPVFAQKRERTLEMLIKNMHEEYITEINKNNIYRRAFSDVIQESHSSRNKEEVRRAEFVRVGQTLKLKTILKGNAPTSLVTTGLLKREPWEPQDYHNDFPYSIITGDSWGKDSKIHVFRLTDFEGEYNETIVRTKTECREHKLEKTKGCHLYALSRPGASHLRMVVAIQKRLLLYTWKHSAAWSAWCPTIDFDIVEGFTLELQAFEVPQLVTLIDGNLDDNQICVGYRNQFDLINEKNGDTLQLYHIDAIKETSHDFDFHWNSEPQAIVCAFPYVIAFTPVTIEIRLIINGNLVHTMTMPELNLITSKLESNHKKICRLDILFGYFSNTCTLMLEVTSSDIYFSSVVRPGHSPLEKKEQSENSFTPPPSPSCKY
ncbi:hypothetical protein KUTeg_022392 [Tegillarca granosa]|uniref:Rap-GAP domain-containing protein n=1 Tax=Tegillarca granosa TaxID=220873 RepID=A0ABQ9E641_TEGGR|nr:hypothetical protein KUTeg_022392 [Tegillarca granosa]